MRVVAPRGYRQHLGGMPLGCCSQLTPGQPAYVRIRPHTSAYVSIRQHTSAYVSIRQHTSAYVSIRQHTSAYVSILEACRLDVARSSHQVSLLLRVSIRPFVLVKASKLSTTLPQSPLRPPLKRYPFVLVSFCASKASKLSTTLPQSPAASTASLPARPRSSASRA
jgi:hypothetical protein